MRRAPSRRRLTEDPTVDGILTLGPTGAAPALAALEGNDQIMLATFDLSPEVLTAIEDGTILFAIDQQQYLQGYLGVLIVTQFAQYGLLPGGGQPILTGPGFVDAGDRRTGHRPLRAGHPLVHPDEAVPPGAASSLPISHGGTAHGHRERRARRRAGP